ncbi:MAG: DNA polymerase III [Candidatus Omnitrophica bacterium CG1_02_41_171]|nr:MAG: DNA polymerase III [Candidatus Omnitrophica bacterium CG1_02_41_171]HCG77001.1 DNA polymerase/3'-5' exonuclease PolX [bacterium]
MKNQEIAEIFEKIGDILEFKGENPFKINAYRRASQSLRDLSVDLEKIAGERKLRGIPGVGEGIAQKIEEYLKTGRIKKYEEIKKEFPEEIISLLKIPGVGPKTLSLLDQKFKIKNLAGLEKVIENKSLTGLPGMGEKKVKNIKKGIEFFEKKKGRTLLGVALPLLDEIIDLLKPKVEKISSAGSLRRMKEDIGDIDILTTAKNSRKVIDYFISLPFVERILARGETKASIISKKGIQIDLRVVPSDSYGAALQYFTGSKSHNIKLRSIAKEKGMKINEYGLFKGTRKIAGKNEEEIYQALGLPYIPPELREDQGEIEAAREKTLPSLVKFDEIKGDFHIHSEYSDGEDSIRMIAETAGSLGLSYLAICDHSQSVKYAGGLSIKDVLKRNEEIDYLNKKSKRVKILKGMEVDILADGTLDYSDALLRELDLVIAAIHQGFRKNVTGRMRKAMQNPNVDIIAHPTGRLISKREGYRLDLDKIFEIAAETDTALEINACYDRLDLNDNNSRRAKDFGVKLAIGSDSHSLGMLKYLKLGVAVARRGWLEKKDVLNTYPLTKILKRKNV